MLQERLTNMSIMCIECDIRSKIDLVYIIDNFADPFQKKPLWLIQTNILFNNLQVYSKLAIYF